MFRIIILIVSDIAWTHIVMDKQIKTDRVLCRGITKSYFRIDRHSFITQETYNELRTSVTFDFIDRALKQSISNNV